MNILFPERADRLHIFRSADIGEILRAKWLQQRIVTFEKREEQPSKLWLDHFRSVDEFDGHLTRIGGLEHYTSPMEKMRRAWGEPTIRYEIKVGAVTHGQA